MIISYSLSGRGKEKIDIPKWTFDREAGVRGPKNNLETCLNPFTQKEIYLPKWTKLGAM